MHEQLQPLVLRVGTQTVIEGGVERVSMLLTARGSGKTRIGTEAFQTWQGSQSCPLVIDMPVTSVRGRSLVAYTP